MRRSVAGPRSPRRRSGTLCRTLTLQIVAAGLLTVLASLLLLGILIQQSASADARATVEQRAGAVAGNIGALLATELETMVSRFTV